MTKHKAYHFTRGKYFGHLGVILTENKYRDAISDQKFVYAAPTDQGAYDPNVENNMNAAQRAQEEAEHKRENVSYEVYLGVAEACRDLITKILDYITPEGLDMLEESIDEILTKHKAYHFTRGTDFGHLEVILMENKYRDSINDQPFVNAAPTDQGAYDINAGNNMNAAQRAQE